jgi:arsenate reductase (thioredoxin)
MKKVLVICTGNSCRSQMAHGYLNKFKKCAAEIYSAGIETHGVNQKAIEVMKLDGIDISHHTSNNVNEYAGINFNYVITVCDNAKESCPHFHSPALKFHYNFTDPSKVKGTEEEIQKQFIETRDTIKQYIERFCKMYLNDYQ